MTPEECKAISQIAALREELAAEKERSAQYGRSFNSQCRKTDDLQQRLADAERRIADRDALLRSTSARLWNAHLALNRLIELEPAHKVKLLTDTIHAVAYAHKCIDMQPSTNPKRIKP